MTEQLAVEGQERLVVGPEHVPVRVTTLNDAADAVVDRARARRPGAVHLVNAYSVVCAHRHAEVARALQAGAVNLMDGMPLVWLCRALGAATPAGRVYGPDLLLAVADRGREAGLRHYFYGGTPTAVTGLAAALTARFPGLQVVGHESPPFRALTDEETAAAQLRITASDADVVWVGLGTPRQDVLSHQWSSACDATFVAVGAAFDFISGTKRQAPRLLQRAGLEWLFRLATEPRRLAGRYLLGNLAFLRLVAGRAAVEPHDQTPDRGDAARAA